MFIAWYKKIAIDVKALILNICFDVKDVKDLFALHTYIGCWSLSHIMMRNVEIRGRSKNLRNCLPLSIVAKNSILNVAEFLDPSLKSSPCTKTSPMSCENQHFFLLFRNLAAFIESHCVFLCYFLQYDEELLSSLLDSC